MEYDLRCSVCWELFEDPAILDCSHTFCAKCLVPVSKRFKRSIKATCPLCKEITTATQAKGYRRNRLVVKVIAAYKAEFLQAPDNDETCKDEKVVEKREVKDEGKQVKLEAPLPPMMLPQMPQPLQPCLNTAYTPGMPMGPSMAMMRPQWSWNNPLATGPQLSSSMWAPSLGSFSGYNNCSGIHPSY